MNKLVANYWFSVEFGICREDGQLKAYGAALLSSFGELIYAMGKDPDGKKPIYEPFQPEVTGITEYPLLEYQPKYFIAESFKHAKQLITEYAKTIDRPFDVRYDPYQSCK